MIDLKNWVNINPVTLGSGCCMIGGIMLVGHYETVCCFSYKSKYNIYTNSGNMALRRERIGNPFYMPGALKHVSGVPLLD